MANVKNEPTMNLRSKAEMKLLLYGLTPSKAHNERVRAYRTLHGLLEQIGSIPENLQNDLKTLWLIIQQDILSSNEEIAVHSLRVLGIILRFAKLTDTVACNFLTTLLSLITTTSRKRIFTLGLRCISTQELSLLLLVRHLKMIVASIVHGIDNPRGSLTVTCEAFQAVTQLTKQLPCQMREHSVSWAPPLYHKILNWKSSELAEKCLSDVQNVVLPPIAELTEAVVTDIQLRLETKMKSLVKGDEREAVSAVRAWSWLIKFLGRKVLEEKTLINGMLQILETSFTSPHVQVRNATQVAWVSMIDAFVPSVETVRPTEVSESAKAPSRADNSSRKRLKLLMTPLVTTISWEKAKTIQRSCCCTWIYLLCRLGARVNECSEFDTAVLPMLETVFQLGPKRTDGFVWATCVDVFTSITARNNSGGPSPRKAVQMSELVLDNSPRTPVGEAYEGVLSGVHHQKIQWASWRLERLDSLLKLVKLLWSHGVAQFDEAPQELPEEYNLDAAVGCWRLLVQGVKAEDKSSVRPSEAHVTAVHLLLNSYSWACKSCSSQGILSAVWQLAEILIEVLQPVILTSSFYKVQPPLEDLSRYMTEKLTDSFPLEESIMDMVTPVVYISAVWFDLILRSEFGAEPEDLLLRRVTSVITTARSGFDVMGTFHGFATTLDCLGKGISSVEEMSPSTNMQSMKSDSISRNWGSLLNVWRTVAGQLREHVDRAGDVPLVAGGDFDYTVTWTLLLFPVKFFLRLSLREYHESRAEKSENVVLRLFKGAFAVSETQLLSLESTWFRLYNSVSQISSFKPSSSNAFIGGFFKNVLKVLKHVLQEGTHGHSSIKVSSLCLRFLGDVVVHAMKHAEVPNFAMLAISRKRRKTGFGASSVRVQYLAGVESEDACDLRDLFVVASKLLTLSFEHLKSGESCFPDLDVVIRVFGALAGIAQQTTSQNDALRLLKVFSQPFTRWLGIGAEGRGKECVTGVTPETLEDALSQAWDGILSCLQACHPGLTFDSALLDIQAPTLSIALLHTHRPIADRALSFWEAAYGIKGYPLKYPSSLVEVFCKLRRKVEVSLPGWSTGTTVVKQKFAGGVYTRHPLAKFMPHNAGREQHLSLNFSDDIPCKNLVGTNLLPPEPCSGSTAGMMKETVSSTLHVVESTLQEEYTSDFAHAHKTSSGVEGGEHLASAADEVSPPSTLKGEVLLEDGSFEDFMSIVNSALKEIPGEATSNSCPENTAIVTEFFHAPGVRMDDGQAPVNPLLKDWSFYSEQGKSSTDHGNMKSLDSLQELQRLVVTAKQFVTDGSTAPLSYTSALITPPVTSIDAPLSPPKIPGGGERDVHITVATVDPNVQVVGTVNQPGSKLPQRRKKLKFQDDAPDIEFGVPQSLQGRTSFPLVHNNCAEIQNLHKVQLMEKTSVHIRKLQSCDDVLNSPAGITEIEDFGVSCKENVPPNVPQNLDLVTPFTSLKQTEVAEPPSRCPENDHSSAGLRSSVKNQLDLFQMKERLATLHRLNPTLTFRDIVRSEQYNALPRQVLMKLKKHVDELKARFRLDNINTAANGEYGARPSQGGKSQYCEKEKLRVTVDAVNQALAEDDSGQQFRREDASNASLLEQEAESQQLPGEENADHTTLCKAGMFEQIPSRRPRVLDVLVPRPKALNLRSSGKLRGRKHWRTDAEAQRACTLRSGSKEVSVRRRRSLNSNSVPHKDERTESARLAEKVFRGDLLAGVKAPVAKVAEVKPAPSHQVSIVKDYLQCDDSGFRIRELHRGMFDMSYGATEVVEPRSLGEDAVQMREQITRSSHSRKCRFPKRMLRFPCGDGYHKETTAVVTETVDAMDFNDSVPNAKFSRRISAECDDDRLHTQITTSAERLIASLKERHLLQEASSTDLQSKDGNTKDPPNTDVPVCREAERKPQADYLCPLPVITHTNEADHSNHPESAVVPREHMELNDEIERLLQWEGVRVYHILVALAASPEWISLKDVEVVEADKLIHEISRMLAKRERSESPMFTTPPTHFTQLE